jgi:hypothetical protein
MFPYRTLAGNGCGINRPNTGIEASKTVGEASILCQLGGGISSTPHVEKSDRLQGFRTYPSA